MDFDKAFKHLEAIKKLLPEWKKLQKGMHHDPYLTGAHHHAMMLERFLLGLLAQADREKKQLEERL